MRLAVTNRRTVNGDEQDAYGPGRRFYRWPAGKRAAIKRRTHKRERREWQEVPSE